MTIFKYSISEKKKILTVKSCDHNEYSMHKALRLDFDIMWSSADLHSVIFLLSSVLIGFM